MQYAGQNLLKLAEDFRDNAKKLTIAGFYDHGLTLTMLKIFLEAGGDGCCAKNFWYKIYQWIKQAGAGRSHADYSIHGEE
jgi:hypothetical protein